MALLKIARIEADRFQIPFIRPVKIGGRELSVREGFILSLKDREGRTGFGEVAPLPGWDPISLDKCLSDLSLLARLFSHASFDTDQFNITTAGLGLMELPDQLAPQSVFALECALMSLCLQSRLNRNASGFPDPIKMLVNGLFVPDPINDEVSAQIHTLLQQGMKTIKVKIGRLSMDLEISQIRQLADAVGENLILRLDGNKSLTAETCLHYGVALNHLNIEYAEEPLRDGENLPSNKMPWPIALDESLPGYLDLMNPDPSNLPPFVKTVILKPGLFMGLSGMARLIRDAEKQNIKCFLSSAFNTGITLAALGAFSVLARFPSPTAHGLDTLRYLKTDVLTTSPFISEGMLVIPIRLFSEMSVNRNVLKKEKL